MDNSTGYKLVTEEWSPSWEGNSSSVDHKIPFYGTPMFIFIFARSHPSLFYIVSQMNPVHTATQYSFKDSKIQFHITLQYTHLSPMQTLSFIFRLKLSTHFSFLCSRYKLWKSHHLNNVWRIQTMMQFSSFSCYSFLVKKFCPHTSICVLPRGGTPSFTLIQNNRYNYGLVYLNLTVLDSRYKDKNFLNWMAQTAFNVHESDFCFLLSFSFPQFLKSH